MWRVPLFCFHLGTYILIIYINFLLTQFIKHKLLKFFNTLYTNELYCIVVAPVQILYTISLAITASWLLYGQTNTGSSLEANDENFQSPNSISTFDFNLREFTRKLLANIQTFVDFFFIVSLKPSRYCAMLLSVLFFIRNVNTYTGRQYGHPSNFSIRGTRGMEYLLVKRNVMFLLHKLQKWVTLQINISYLYDYYTNMFIFVAILIVKDINIVDNKLYNVGLIKILKYVDLCLMNLIFFVILFRTKLIMRNIILCIKVFCYI